MAAPELSRGPLAPLGQTVPRARIGEDAWAVGDSKRPDAQPLRFTSAELEAAGIDPARFGLPV